ncbi:MAG: calcium/sodium antiporter [Bacteroidales bacterium]|mgnify:CR=1 FL=1
MVYILFVIGFVLLIYGANFLVDGAASLARRFKISNIVIGLTIVALGTSSPELVVNLVASFQGSADVALGNILGSNISNIFLILGVSALIFPLTVNNNTHWKEIPLALLAAVVLAVSANDAIIDGHGNSFITRTDGITLIFFFFLFMYYAFGIAGEESDSGPQIREYSPLISWLMIVGGIVGLVLGGKWIVDGAIVIASSLGMSEALISLTIVAVGTSLPELATCVVAAMKRNPDIVVGNVIGSNIFNVFFVLGSSAVIKPLPFNQALNFDVLVGVFSCVLLFVFLLIPRRKVLDRWQGGVFVAMYIAYIVFLVVRG